MESVEQSLASMTKEPWRRLGEWEPLVAEALERLRQERTTRRIWGRDGSLWKEDPAAVQEIEDRLGWLDLPSIMRVEVGRLKALAVELQAVGYRRAVLLGMGGSSLAAEVYREAFGVAKGFLDVTVLDSTDPTQILRVEEGLRLEETVFIVSSKSGTTPEMRTLYEYFRERCESQLGDGEWPAHMIAITDPETPLASLATAQGFRALYLNPPDVGGRFSGLSLFGLVPAALLGIDLDRLLERAEEMARACRVTLAEGENPAMVLGAAMGALAADASPRRDKLTLLASPGLRAFGPWMEQLVAESTGKGGRGIVPVVGEPLAPPEALGSDRFWVYLRLMTDDNAETDAAVARLAAAGEPVMAFPVRDVYDLGAEFFRWEYATAVAGKILGVNPFDQPDVDSAKRQAQQALDRYEETQTLSEEVPLLEDGALALYGPPSGADDVAGYLAAFFEGAQPGDYAGLLAYVERRDAHAAVLERIAAALRGALRIPVTVGFGPRFLHSTGQLHKGGPGTGLFLQITPSDARDLPIPERGYSFGVLKRAQAIGDLNALRDVGRRVVRVDIGEDVPGGLEALEQAIEAALAHRNPE